MNDRITTPFGFASTADDVLEGVKLHGQRAIVTGGSSGIGIDTARVLAASGAEVTLAVRNVAAGQKVADDINATLPQARVRVARCMNARFVSAVWRICGHTVSTRSAASSSTGYQSLPPR